MIKVLGAKDCPDCIELKKNFDFFKIDYEFVDIQASVKNLKEFMQLRDTDSFYDKARLKGLIGIPTLIFENGEKSFYWKKYLEELGYTPFEGEISCNTKEIHC